MKPPPAPLHQSGLTEGCSRFFGKPLLLRCEAGWGWTHKVHGRSSLFDDEALFSSRMRIEPEGFVEFPTPRSGIYGKVIAAPSPYSQERFVAFTMTDGCDYDFYDHIAPAWRVMLGDGILDYDSHWFPILNGNDVCFGYGSIGVDDNAFALAEARRKNKC